jgi:RNA polymerase sigma factor (sigma-70 family)
VPTDAELIGSSLDGDRDAFVVMTRRHAGSVWGYLVRRAGPDTAADLLEEVWTEAFASRSSYDRAYPDARPWLFGVAADVLHRHWRSLDRRPPRAAGGHRIEPSVDPWTAVDDHLDGVALLGRALEQLRPGQRQVLCLVAWEQLTVTDAARALGIPAATARRHLHDARQALRASPHMTALLRELHRVKELS